MDETMLQEQLRSLAASQDGQLPGDVAADLRMGRTRLRRNRLVWGGGALAAVALVGAGSVAAVDALGSDGGPGGSSRQLQPASQPEAEPSGTESEPPTEWTWASPYSDHQETAWRERLGAAMDAHLDPGGQDLDYDVTEGEHSATFREREGGDDNVGIGAIGFKGSWLQAGEPGAGYVTVWETPSAALMAELGLACEDGFGTEEFECTPVDIGGGFAAEVSEQTDQGFVVSAVRPNGEAVTVHVRNETPEGDDSVELTPEQVLDLVQDDRLTLPVPN